MIVPSRAAALLPLLALGACSNSMHPLEAHLGDDGIWSLVIVKPGTTGDDGIEHLLLRSSTFDVINSAATLAKLVEKVPPDVEALDCVAVEHASVLTTRSRVTQRKIISFGRQSVPSATI